MNILLWVLQVLGALLYLSSGVMKAFMLEKISSDVPSFGALPRNVWRTLGLIEITCALGLVAPAVLHRWPYLCVAAAALLAIESLVFIWVHVRYREATPLIMSGALGLLMAFVAYGRWLLVPFA